MSYWLFKDSVEYLKKIDEDGECFTRDIWVRREGNCYVFEQRIDWYREAPLSKIIPIATVNRGMPEQQLYVYLCEQVCKKIVRLGGQARRIGLGERVKSSSRKPPSSMARRNPPCACPLWNLVELKVWSVVRSMLFRV